MVCMGNLSNSWYANFSNPPTNINFDHPEYLGQPDSYGDIPGHRVFSFLDLRVLWTLKSSLVLIFGMRLVDRKIQQQRSEKPMGNTIQFVPSLLGAVISVVAMSYNFLTREKHSIRFIETLRNYQQRKPLRKDLQNGTVFICRFNFRQHCGHSRCYIHFGGRFFLSLAGGRHVLFSRQFSAVYLSFDIQSTCSFNTWILFLFSSMYDEGIHNSIQSRFPVPAAHIQRYFSDISSGKSRYQNT